MAEEERHIRRISDYNKTELRTNIDQGQCGIEGTETNVQDRHFVYKDPDGNYFTCASQHYYDGSLKYIPAEFGESTTRQALINATGLQIDEYFRHIGDPDTNIRMQTDQQTINVGNVSYLDIVESGSTATGTISGGMIINGNVGIGVVPEDSDSDYTVLQIGGYGSIVSETLVGGDMFITTNAYYDAVDQQWESIGPSGANSMIKIGSGGSIDFYADNTSGSDVAITWENPFTVTMNYITVHDDKYLYFGSGEIGIKYDEASTDNLLITCTAGHDIIFNDTTVDSDIVFNGDTAEVCRIDAGEDVLYFPDSKEIGFGNSATSPDIKMYSDGTDGIIESDNLADIVLQTSSTTYVRIDESNNVMVGISSAGTNADNVLVIANGTHPTGSYPEGGVLFAEDVAAISELCTINESGVETILSGETRQRKTADQSVTSSVALVNDTHLSFPIAANEIKYFTAELYVICGIDGSGIDVAINGPASPTNVIMGAQIINSSGTALGNYVDAYETEILFPGVGYNRIAIKMSGTIENGANAGTVYIRWAQNASQASATTVKRGSFLEAKKIV